ncbi:hypothetical protein [Bartonella sp. HY406]|uniref:hypothetical protein n=1 Tax=Bartonella sp. HY406 TaxID=2979331 RepID=UPI0021C72A31|nr:hypothetical protein [Bartonella sp. HY406]UXN04325.1 hypothetical protein N6B01_04675 [Bartonella sp. HY406]
MGIVIFLLWIIAFIAFFGGIFLLFLKKSRKFAIVLVLDSLVLQAALGFYAQHNQASRSENIKSRHFQEYDNGQIKLDERESIENAAKVISTWDFKITPEDLVKMAEEKMSTLPQGPNKSNNGL